VVAYDDEQALGQIIFTGDIAIIDTQSGRSESVTVTAIGVVERLTSTPLIVGGSYSHTYSSETVEEIFKSIILSYNNQNPQYPLKFTDSSIGTTGVTTTLTFNNANCWKALQEAFETTEQDWVFFIDSDNTVFLKQISSTPDHYLFFGKDVVSVSRTQDKTEIVNNLLVWDGDTSSPIARRYFNQDSIDTYGIRTESKRDGRFTTTAGMDDFGDAQVLRQKDPNDQVTITVLDSAGGGFDIETIQVGDVVKLLNIGTEADLGSNLVVTTKIDKLDYCELVCFDTEAFVNRELANLKENQQKVNYEDGPSSYTGVAVT
jgi:phage minor structural protein